MMTWWPHDADGVFSLHETPEEAKAAAAASLALEARVAALEEKR